MAKISVKKLKHMTTSQITKAYLEGKITKKQHSTRMQEIGTRRHAEDIRKRKYRPDMSSTGWRR